MTTIWKTDEKLRNKFDIANNVEVTLDDKGYLSIRVVRSREGEEPLSLMKTLSPIDAINMGVALIRVTGSNER